MFWQPKEFGKQEGIRVLRCSPFFRQECDLSKVDPGPEFVNENWFLSAAKQGWGRRGKGWRLNPFPDTHLWRSPTFAKCIHLPHRGRIF
jgi:hypothetical protein